MENKKEYVVYITETLQRKVLVNAETMSDAIEQVQEQYDNSEIVLDSSDYLEVDFNAREK